MNGNYIDRLASRIHEIADADPRIKALWGGDGSSPELLRAYALLALTTGAATTLENVHDAWSSATATARPEHRYLVPMNDVPPDVQDLDQPYVDAICTAAREAAGLSGLGIFTAPG